MNDRFGMFWAIWYILWPYVGTYVPYVHMAIKYTFLVRFVVIWFMFSRFGMLYQ
jgi:hypothetical protein